MSFLVKNEEEENFLDGIESLPDRIVGVLVPTLLEGRLEDALKSYMHDTKDGSSFVIQELFRDTGPLGPFKTKARLGFALGLYGADAISDISNIIKIRNLFAHNIKPDSFQENQIKAICKNLKTPDLYPIKEVSEIDDGILYNWDLAFHVVQESTVSNMDDPRERFIRANEILSWLICFTETVPALLPKPKF